MVRCLPGIFSHYIDIDKKMNEKELAIHSVNPTWDYWKHIDGVVSEKTISTILFELRNASTSI